MTHDPKIDERAELEALMADWQAKGGIPMLVTTCRQEKTSRKVTGPQGRPEYQWRVSPQ